MTHEPWYQDGLQFTCTQCGNCCTGPEGFVWVNEVEVRQIAEHIGMSADDMEFEHTRRVGRRVSLKEFANGDCTFFDGRTRRCSVYPVRPQQCRTWPFWNSNLQSLETWRQVQQVCPGAGHGNFFSLEEIEAQAAVFRV